MHKYTKYTASLKHSGTIELFEEGKQHAKLFEADIRANTDLKGEITPTRLRYHGIRYKWNRETGEHWVEQRGKRISYIYIRT